ncbi:MAG: D-alanyl-D-alanine carboxypeptidase/D-alanyl-D-alanine-endopeptidase [Chloroflexi bacterium]|nr:D-alanyl-D-alanine carboxypeptidase/D-alanyl-D-alanine-endopeptidase [Chloroflexota bacterium]
MYFPVSLRAAFRLVGIAALLLLAIGAPSSATAAPAPVAVSASVSHEGSAGVASISVTNNTGAAVSFEIRATIPPGGRLLSASPPQYLFDGQTVRWVNPGGVSAGETFVGYQYRFEGSAEAIDVSVDYWGSSTGSASAGPVAGGGIALSPEIRQIVESPEFAHTTWGLLAVDLETGQEVYESLNPALMFDPASTTKLFTVAAAIDILGADHRFRTPVYKRGQIDANGQLVGDLILVASGDLALGGRRDPDGQHLEYTDYDHTDANGLGIGVLTPADPLAGLDDLAQQVRKSGIRAIEGDVVIDARLFGPGRSVDPHEDYLITPIVINDNRIDLSITATEPGSPAQIDWRPQTAAYTVINEVTTASQDVETNIAVLSPSPGKIVVSGQVPTGAANVVRTYTVQDPASFARTLFIEALQRAGVEVDALELGANPSKSLPDPGDYASSQRVAQLVSLPFSEYAKLILKVSHNQGADTLLYLMAVQSGGKTMVDGLRTEYAFLQRAGVDLAGVVLRDGQGATGANFISPQAVVQLLHYMSTRDDFQVYRDALPIMGVDGTLAHLVEPDSPISGKLLAKTGTHGIIDEAGMRILILSRGLAGYLTTSSGRGLIVVVYLNNIGVTSMEDWTAVMKKHGSIFEAIYQKY